MPLRRVGWMAVGSCGLESVGPARRGLGPCCKVCVGLGGGRRPAATPAAQLASHGGGAVEGRSHELASQWPLACALAGSGVGSFREAAVKVKPTIRLITAVPMQTLFVEF